MFIEKKRKGVEPRLFTVNGNKNGLITVSDASDFYVKQTVFIHSSTQPIQELEIKRFISNNSFKVGPKGYPISTFADISKYLVIDGAGISAPEQERPGIKPDEHNRAVYAEEPVVAKRVISVDSSGNYYSSNNPVPVAGSLTIDTSETVGINIINQTISLANTDYSIALPSKVRRFILKIRDGKGPLRVYESPNGPFYTVSKGSVYDSNSIKNPSLSLLVQSSQPNSIVEIFCWVSLI